MGGWRYLLRKVWQVLTTLLFVLIFNFVLFRIAPGDPVRLLTRSGGTHLSPTAIQSYRHDFGLDLPLLSQLKKYLLDMVRLRLNDSFTFEGTPVTHVFLRFLWPTLLLVGTATVLMTIIGIYLGIRGGWNRGGKMDLASMGGSLVFYSAPDFWIAMMLLILFSTTLGWFPSGGRVAPNSGLTGVSYFVDILNHLFLPCFTLVIGYLGEYYLIMRSSLLDVMGEDYITTVRAKGIREGQVLWRHAVRNALLPTISEIALGFGFIIGGAITVEWVFSYPGLGLLTINAIDEQDYPLLQGIFLFSSAAVLVSNLIADLLYSWFDPRVREA
jgi:peptide/nickel transport system permease protein